MTTVEVAWEGTDVLGECPLWDDQAQAIYWVDGRAPALHRLHGGGAKESWALPEIIGSFAFRTAGGLLVAIQSGLYTFDLETRALEPVAQPETDKPDNRFNDGRCDRAGRFWSGTMTMVSRDPLGSLYRLDPDGSCTKHLNEIIVPNSIAWSPDNKTMYFADTYKKYIWSFDYDIGSGAISNRQLFSDLTNKAGRPDGSAVDSEGCLWNCEYAGGQVVRYTPSGKVDQVITMPVANPTCCAFGGTDLRTLYITSARQRLTPEEIAAQPLIGSLFAVRTSVPGLPEGRFGA